MSRAIIKLLPNSSYRRNKLSLLTEWFHQIVDYVDDTELNNDLRDYKSIEHIKILGTTGASMTSSRGFLLVPRACLRSSLAL